MLKPKIDPCIFLHSVPDDWTQLLGVDFVNELVKRFRHVARDLDDVVKFVTENPSVSYLALRGMKIGGVYRHEWILFAESGYVSPSYRTRWPPVAEWGVLDLRIQTSPCYLLTSLRDGRSYVWRNRASSLFKWIHKVPQTRPLEVFRQVFPQWLRELANKRGYSWVAWSKWRDRRNKHLAEWLYWLDTGRMPHVDMTVGRWSDMCRNAYCTKIESGEVLYNTP